MKKVKDRTSQKLHSLVFTNEIATSLIHTVHSTQHALMQLLTVGHFT